MIDTRKIYQGDCLEILKQLPDESIDCCVTSPPYYGLRDYGTGTWVGGDPKCPHKRISKYSPNTITGHGQEELVGNVGDAIYKTVCPLCGAVRVDKQIGLEETPEEYIKKLTEVFHEVKRVLKDDGTLWVNIGDTYNSNSYHKDEKSSGYGKHGTNRGVYENVVERPTAKNCKPKDLIGIPWMLAFSLRADGWYLRQDIIWSKTNPMPEPVQDRCTKSHEYIFLLSKQSHYYYDAESISEPIADATIKRLAQDVENQDGSYTPSKGNGNTKAVFPRFGGSKYGENEDKHFAIYSGKEWKPTGKRNKRDVWQISVQPTREAHFATFPEKLVEPCILAGCREDGVVLDPFFGSGTTGRVAERLNRRWIGIELNPKYIEIAKKRTNNIQTQLLI